MLLAVRPLGVYTAAVADETATVNAPPTAAAKIVRPCIGLLQTENGRPASFPSPIAAAVTCAGIRPARIGLYHSVTGATLAHRQPTCQDQFRRRVGGRPGTPSYRAGRRLRASRSCRRAR